MTSRLSATRASRKETSRMAPTPTASLDKPGTLRRVLLQVHLWLGLTAAIFLALLGLTGSIMAFEGDIDRWLNPGLWYVSAGARALPEAELIGAAEQKFSPARVALVQVFRQPNLARLMQMTNRTAV